MLDFPASPTNGQLFIGANGVVYQWNAAGGMWVAYGMGMNNAVIASTPPANPTPGQLWWSQDLGQLFIYYNDPNTSQWVPAAPAPSVVTAIGAASQLYDEQILGAPAAQIIVRVPVKARRIEIDFNITSSNTAANDGIILQGMEAGAIIGGSGYFTQLLYGVTSTAGGALYTGQTYWRLGDGEVSAGTVRGGLSPSPTNQTLLYGQMNIQQTTAPVIYNFTLYGGPNPALIDAFRLASLNAVNFAANSWVRSYVVQ